MKLGPVAAALQASSGRCITQVSLLGSTRTQEALCRKPEIYSLHPTPHALDQVSLEASRKTQKALALEISIDKLRLVLQQHGISDADCSLNDSRLSTGDGGGRVSLEGDHSSAALSLDVTGLGGMEEAACDGSGSVSAGTVMMQHTMQQAAMSDELHTIEESLGLKEKLLEQLQEGERRMQSLKSADEEELRRLQQQLQQLQQERDELQRKANDKTKLTQLEEQLAGMRRRVQESERALRLKHDTDRRIQVPIPTP